MKPLREPHGGDAMPQILRAGPLRLAYENGEIRGLALEGGRIEVVRRIYGAVRDRDWATVAARISDEQIEDGGDHFRVSFHARHAQDDIDFAWRGEIRGSINGTVTFAFDGEAQTTFERNRIGLCVLHPIRECVGAAARVEHADNSVEVTTLPRQIAPHEPFQAFTALSHQIEGEMWARFAFEGEVFETEDQRNWIDASFKTFGTPLSLPYPVRIEVGTRIRQSVTIELQGHAPSASARLVEPETVRITIGERAEKKLPPLGLSAKSEALSSAEIAALRTLGLHHLRLELSLNSEFENGLRVVAAQAKALDCALEIALFVGEEASRARLDALAQLLDELQVRVHAFLIFADRVRVAPRAALEEARRILGRLAPVGSGSNANFAELNRQPMPAETLDLVTFAANPQVHAFDDQSVMETPEAVPHAVHSARALYAGKSVFISPLTLKPRFNAVATGPEREPLPGELPPGVDARQKTPFCAAWTLAVLASLAQCGFGAYGPKLEASERLQVLAEDSLTLFETSGPRGVMDEDGPFPVFELLRQIAPLREQNVFLTASTDARRAVALAFESEVFVANLEAQALRVEVEAEQARLEPYETRRFQRKARR